MGTATMENNREAPSKFKNRVAQSCLTFCNPWSIDGQVPLPMEFSRQDYWNGLPFPSPGDLSDQGIELRSLALQADSLPSEPQGKLKTLLSIYVQLLEELIFLRK